MIEIGNKVITVSIPQIINDLKEELALKEMDYLRETKVVGDDLMVTCPFHKNGKESKPSCGITLKRIGDTPEGTVHCFTCGRTSSIEEMIAYIFNRSVAYGEEWLLERYTSQETRSRENELRDVLTNILQPRTQWLEKPKYVSEEELSSYRYYHPYMYKRKLTNEVINLFDVGYDRFTQCLTFPVNDIHGNCVFIARRNVNYKMFNYPPNVEKPIYGLDKIPYDKDIYVCESIINALTLWTYGYYAVALLGTGTKLQYQILRDFPCRRLILCLDGDEAGARGTEKIKTNVPNKLIEVIPIPQGKDVNDLSKEEFENLKIKKE